MSRPFVIVVGNAIAETVLTPTEAVNWGDKYTAPAADSFGGSAIDYSRRLLSAGIDVYPVMLIGNDQAGNAVRELLKSEALAGRTSSSVQAFLDGDGLAVPGASTLRSTIILANGRRTIFSHQPRMGEDFLSQLERRVAEAVERGGGSPSAVMIGHVYGDGEGSERRARGRCTRWLVDRFAGSSLMLANFGNTQIRFGIDFWEPVLARMNLLQANVRELRAFFTASGKEGKSLAWMLDWLRARGITTVVTAGQCGAVGTYQDGRDGVYTTSGTSLEVVDPTGAGDAFASGVMAEILARGHFGFEDFYAAMSMGRAWAAFACTTVGGSGPAPSRSFLDRLSSADAGKPVISVEDPTKALARMAAIDNAVE